MAQKSKTHSKTHRKTKTDPVFTLDHLTVGLTASDAAASVQWYCDVLGFTVRERWERDGQFSGASVTFGHVTINIGQDDWQKGRDRVKGQGTRLYITTGPGIERYAADVQARGGVLDQPLSEGWGYTLFAISDPDTFKLTFMAPLKK